VTELTAYAENHEAKIFDGMEEPLPLMKEWLRERYSQLTGARA